MSGSLGGLSVSDVVKVDINLSPVATPVRNFGALVIVGSTDVINPSQRVRQYTTLDGVTADFGTTVPEYLAADLFFSQSPQPSVCYVARYAPSTTAGQLVGATLSSTEQASLLTALKLITTGGMTISVDGTPRVLANLDFHSITNLNGAATVIGTALTQATVLWTGSEFTITSKTSGLTSTVSYATNPGTGAALATELGLTQAAGAQAPYPGTAGESAVAAVTAIRGRTGDIYGITFALASPLSDDDMMAVAAYVEGASPSSILGVTSQDANCLDANSTSDIGYRLSAAKYSRTCWQYSSSSPYAIASLLGRAFTVDFTANNSVITLMWKQEPGVVGELLTESEVAALKAKHGNVFVDYQNNTAIIQNGVMSDGSFFDERQGTDWLQNQVQTDLFNFFYTSPTKIPQTDPGIHQMVAVVEGSMARSVVNGLVAPGVWNSSFQFGPLKTGDALTKGYIVFAPSIASQSQADREARKAPTIQVAAKLAGAVHSANVAIAINR